MLNPNPADWGEKIAASYDHSYGQHGDLPAMASFLSQLSSPGSSIVEVGAGTGRVAAEVATMTRQRVVGVDVSPAMIASLRARPGANVEGIVADICETTPDIVADVCFCVFNSLFMMGDPKRQASALCHMREMTSSGGTLVLENFQPVGAFFEKNSASLEPVGMTNGSVQLAMSRIDVNRGVIEGTDIILTDAGSTLAPCLFHYRTCEQVDADAAAAGWTLRQRYATWAKDPFSADSENAVSVYRAT